MEYDLNEATTPEYSRDTSDDEATYFDDGERCYPRKDSSAKIASISQTRRLYYLKRDFAAAFGSKARTRPQYRPFECPTCKKRFALKSYLKKHVLVHETNPELKYRFKCDVCGRAFMRKGDMKNHNLTVHEPDSNKLSKKDRHKCGVCAKTFSQKITLTTHMSTQHRRSDDSDFGDSDSSDDRSPAFRCEVCKKGFAVKSYLRKHALIHETDPKIKYRFKCDAPSCGKAFMRKADMNGHYRLTHIADSKKPKLAYKCDICAKTFTQKVNLRTHITFTHGRNASSLRHPFKCSICKATFATKSYMKKHMLVHETDPVRKYRFKCEICERPFARKGDMKAHQLTHIAVPYPLKCDICEKEFSQRKSLQEHCSICRRVKIEKFEEKYFD